MIGTIRKHSKWLWWFIAGATIISFVIFMGAPSRNNHGGGGDQDLGTIYGHKVTLQDYIRARHDVVLFYWFRNGDWPKMAEDEMENVVYEQLLLNLKAEKLGIQVSDESAGQEANLLMRSISKEQINFDLFKTRLLPSAGMTEGDFVQFVRDRIAVQELIQTLGVGGELITPQQAEEIFQREHQETSAEMVYFSASNYLSQVPVTPEAVGQFYTNYMAAYRLPDRVQVSYVAFDLTIYFAAAEQKLGKTNLDNAVDANFRQRGVEGVPGAKDAAEAKAKIRDNLLRQQAVVQARTAANAFASEVFARIPARPENLAAVAKDKNLVVHQTEPFGNQYGPQEFMAPESFVKAAFALTPDEPFAGPVAGTESFYVIALDKQLPSEIPPFAGMRDRVAHDYQMLNATARAQSAGTNFIGQLNAQLASGKSFSAACSAAGVHPQSLSPFSLNTGEITELMSRPTVSDQVKRTAFNLAPGQPSNFVETDDGGFVLYLKKRTPVDAATMKAQLPEFIAQLRNMRAGEFFNLWLYYEKNRELKDTPLFKRLTAAQNKS